MSYNNTLPAFEQFSDTVNQAKNMKAHEIGEAILGFSTPILLKASEKGIAAWVKKRSNNLKVRAQGAREGQPVEEDMDIEPPGMPGATELQTFNNPVFRGEGVDVVRAAPAAEDIDWMDNPAFTETFGSTFTDTRTPEQLLQSTIRRMNFQDRQAALRDEMTTYNPGRIRGDSTLARLQQQPVENEPGIEATAINEGQDPTPAVNDDDDVAPVTDETVTGTLDELSLDTSMIPELSTVFAVAGLVGSAIEGFIDIFKHHHVSPEMENLRQIGV